MTTVTFDGVELKTVGPLKPKEDQDNFEITLECFTDDFEDIEEMIARAGKASSARLISGKTKIQTTGIVGTLIIGDKEYPNCAIMDGVQVTEEPGTGPKPYWNYKVRFVQAERVAARPAWYTTAIIGQAPTDTPLGNITTAVTLTSDNYVDLPLSQAVISGIGQSVILTSDNYADIPISDTIMSAITHAVTIVNDV